MNLLIKRQWTRLRKDRVSGHSVTLPYCRLHASVGFAANPQGIGPLVAAGADFVAVGDGIWDDPRGAAAALAEASRLLAPERVP